MPLVFPFNSPLSPRTKAVAPALYFKYIRYLSTIPFTIPPK